VEGAQDSTQCRQFKESSAPTMIALQRQRRGESSAPSTMVRSLRELQWSPSPAIAGAEGKAISFSQCIRIRVFRANAKNVVASK